MSVHIITHCYSVRLNHYAEFLCYQLSSLLRFPPKVKTTITVCCTPTDNNTFRVFTRYVPRFNEGNVTLRCHGMLDKYLFRRCIGRNEVARSAKEEVIWFTDCDHVFNEGCIDSCYKAFKTQKHNDPSTVLVYPRRIKIHETHAIGDLLAEQPKVKEQTTIRCIDESDFVEKKYNRAIGGVQIVDGDYCRQHGYLHGNKKWQQPRLDGKPFGDFKDDIAFRKQAEQHGSSYGVTIRNLFRLRHSLTTYQ